MEIKTKAEAQKRANQIESFQTELELLKKENIITFDENQSKSIANYHKNTLNNLVSTFDVDSNTKEKRLSLGMKIASFSGALALAASVFFLFYRFWGLIPTYTQTFILVAAPLITLIATFFVSKKDKTGYFVKLISLVCLSCFFLNLVMLGQIFNITPSPDPMFIWAAFAFLLAYATNTRLLLGMGIIAFSSFLSAKFGTWNGIYWISFGYRPENFLPVAGILFVISCLPHYKFSGFTTIYRVFALLLFFIPILILSNWGAVSYIHLDHKIIEWIYQLAGFIFSASAIWLGIKKDWTAVTNTGNIFFIIFLYTKFFDWCWDWLPKYLFFLLIGLVSILMLFIFKRMRNSASSRGGI